MKSFRPKTGALMMRRLLTGLLVVVAGATTLLLELPEARAQEIQITGPLAGAPPVRRLRLHREGRFEVAPTLSFTLLDEYRRTIMPGLRGTYHFFDWFGVGLAAGYGVQYNTALSDELQEKAIDQRNCTENPYSLPCKRSAVSLCREGEDCLADSQLGRLQWMVAPQAVFVPFRGKIALFSELFVDTDLSFFIGPAIVGVQERSECAKGRCPESFELEHRVAFAPTFGMGFNFYPLEYLGFGTEFRALPFAWNTSGFDTGGGGEDGDLPDDQVDGEDQSFHFNSMLTIYVSVQLPTELEISD